MKPITWSYGMQSRGGSRIGERPKIEEAVQALADIGGTEAIIFAKDQLRWTKLLLKSIFPEAESVLESESGNVEIASYRGPEQKRFFILLNHGGHQTHLARTVYAEKITSPQPVYQMVLKYRSHAKNIRVKINGQEVPASVGENGLELPVRMDSLWKTIEVDTAT